LVVLEVGAFQTIEAVTRFYTSPPGVLFVYRPPGV
jgi:hypothetical protein